MLRRCLNWLLLLAVLAGLGGALFIWIGLAPVSASAGHWPVTSWLLHTAMREAVQTRAWSIEPPSLQDLARLQRGAGHFARGCASCHGAPGDPRPVTVRHMTPEPPYLPPRIGEWKPRELFWIVKHGVKFTGMPAWPAQQRDDEVWDVVAFLLRLPTLTPVQYRQLAFGDRASEVRDQDRSNVRLHDLDAPLRDVLDDCARCHGMDGLGRAAGAFPRLQHQTEEYLYESLRAFADGTRFSGIMQPLAASLSDRTLRDLARYYADPPFVGTERQSQSQSVDRETLARGERIAKRGVPEQGVASCIHCHGPAPWPRNRSYPLLAAQDPAYIVAQLQLFKDGKRGGTGHAHIMDTSVNRLKLEQMRDVAAYYGALAPASESTSTR